jgi:hypothetical protein
MIQNNKASRFSEFGWGALALAGGSFFFLLSLNGLSDRGFFQFVDATCGIISGAFPVLVSTYLRYRYGFSFGKLLMILALPIGLLYTNVGLIGMVAGTKSSATIGPASAILLLTGLYGAVLSVIGYFWDDGQIDSASNKLSLADLVFLQLCLLVLTLWTMDLSSGIFYYVGHAHVLALYAAIFLVAIHRSKSQETALCTTVANGALVGVLLSLIISLIAWFGSSVDVDSVAINYGGVGMMLGTYVYIAAFLCSLRYGGASSIDHVKKNWHLVEANTFFIFLIFAPQNLGETLREIEDREPARIMEQRIESLTKRIEALEKSE